MKKVLSLIMAAAMVFSLVGILSSCGPREELVMATNANFPPYEYKEGSGYAGIDVEIAEEIAKKLGMKLRIEDVEFGSIIGGVESGKYDMGMAGMTVSDERLEQVDFTTSYAKGIQVVIVRADSGITSLDDLEGKKIGVQQDTTGDIYATDDYGDENITRYKSGADAVQGLLTNKVDCVIIDIEPAKNFIKTNTTLSILDTEYADEDYAICIKKGNTELLEKINAALEELKNDGTIARIIEKYIPAE